MVFPHDMIIIQLPFKIFFFLDSQTASALRDDSVRVGVMSNTHQRPKVIALPGKWPNEP